MLVSSTTGSHWRSSFVTGQDSLLKDRRGVWYVTGKHGNQTHMGNLVVPDGQQPEQLDRTAGSNLLSLAGRFDQSAYLTGYSEIVAHLVLAHQPQMHNLITLTNYQTRLALYPAAARNKAAGLPDEALSDEGRQKYERPAEELIRYLLFTNFQVGP
jgi:hypothetical protein